MKNMYCEVDEIVLDNVMKKYGFKTQKEAINTTLKKSLDLFSNEESGLKEDIEAKKREIEKIAIEKEKLKKTYDEQMEELKENYECELIGLEKEQDQLEQEIIFLTNNLKEMRNEHHTVKETDKERQEDYERLKQSYIYFDGDINEYESSNNLQSLILDYSAKYGVDVVDLINELNRFI